MTWHDEIFHKVKAVQDNFGRPDKVGCYIEIAAWCSNNLGFHFQQSQEILKVIYCVKSGRLLYNGILFI